MVKNLITFSTGNFFKAGQKSDVNRFINLTKKLPIDGVEVLIATVQELNRLKLTKSNIKYLKSLKFNTIHAPFKWNKKKRLYYYNTDKYKKIIEKLNKIYDQINAKNIVIHTNQVKNFRVFDKITHQYSIENSTRRHGLKIKDYTKILKNNPRFRFVLDTSHVSQQSRNLIKNYVKHFKDKIIYVHLSAKDLQGKDHRPLHSADKNVLKHLNPIKKLKCPICIETWTESQNIDLFKKEIAFLRKWLNS